jgi:hypothetical protein
MKAKEGFNLRNVCGEEIIVAEGKENIDFSNIISMNETAAFFMEKASKVKNFSEEDLVKLLIEQYDVEKDIATNDIKALIKQWVDSGIIENV